VARYLAMRLVGLVGVILAVSLITFLIMHQVPGSPFDEDQMPLSAAVKAQMRAKYGLDQPLYAQYATFLANAVRLDFGVSYQSPGETVVQLIGRTWPVSAHLGAMTLVVAFGLGLPLGILAAVRQNSWLDHATTLLAIGGIVTPTFVVAVGLAVVFSTTLRWLPTGGWDEPRQWILPVIAFALHPMAVIARYTRTSMLEAIRSDYVRTARAKGLTEGRVLTVHVLRNALVPLLTILGPLVPGLITGSFFVETIFRVPGLGRYFTTSVFSRDYPMIMGCTVLLCTLIAVTYLVTDVLYTVADPRISYERRR
jgi:ABC-type dipeptide/oligopeptide/nickel transport system permease component